MRTAGRLILGAALMALVVTAAGCAHRGPQFVDENRTYTMSNVSGVLDVADTSPLKTVPVSESQRLRHNALASLRSEGKRASAAANLITSIFPPDAKAVPVYVERAHVDGRAVFLIVEAIGPHDGDLKDKRLWVVDTKGDVLFSATK